MNRIILIGNGFDLAHGLETSYQSFIDDLWRSKIRELKNETFERINDTDIEIIGINVYGNVLPNIINSYQELKSFDNSQYEHKLKIDYKNKFLEKITNKKQLTNWVDVENEYFEELLLLVKNPKGNESLIKKLNQDFQSIKQLLEKYLSNEIDKKKDILEKNKEIFDKIYSYFKVEDFSKLGLESFLKDVTFELNTIIEEQNNTRIIYKSRNHDDLFEYVTKRDQLGKYSLDNDKLKKVITNSELSNHFIDFRPSNCFLLNFNYTNTEAYYSYFQNNFINEINPKVEINHIHGELESIDNPIIFGYGDEIGKDYAIIEEANNNDLLENVKSIRYLDTDNYKKMLEFIESEKYQIFIMGHSCGNSDRTLLNTLFENKNCVSIKVFYHQINENEDNYSDVIRNISRNFNDKKMMREKVVNKKYCSPLVKK